MVGIGDCPFHHFLLRLSGYHAAYYELADHLPQVEHLIKVMEQVEMARLWPVVLDSPAPDLARHPLRLADDAEAVRALHTARSMITPSSTPAVRC
jgi:hypothetical protein